MAETTKPEATTPERNSRKTARGYVVSNKMDKPIVVEIEERIKHRLYGKV
ncbi:30S ribosomal protein S17, partial [Burkholderia multivorans]